MVVEGHSSKRWKWAPLLAALAMVSPFSIDTFFPSFHAMEAYFSVSDFAVQQTLTVYMLPLSMMSLVQGPLSDAIGRRPVILAGLILYTCASAGCALAPNFATLLAFRALQGTSAGVGMIVGRAVIRDLFEGPDAQKLLSLVTMIFGFAPAIAPVIGGWIHVTLGWRGVFGFMFVFGALLAVSTYRMLPETHPKARQAPLHARQLAGTAWSIVRHKEFLLLAFAVGTTSATIMCMIGAAPAIIVDHWHLDETQFAYLFFPVIGGIVTGAWVSGHLAGRVGHKTQAVVGFALAMGGSAALILLHALLSSPPILLQQIALIVLSFGVQCAGPPITLRMLDLFPRARGSAASVQSCVSIAMGAMVFGMISPLLSGSMLALGIGSLSSASIAFLCWRVAQSSVYGPRTFPVSGAHG